MKVNHELIDEIITLSNDVYEIMDNINIIHKQENNEKLRIVMEKEFLAEDELEFLLIDNDIDSSRHKLYDYIGKLKFEEKKLILILSWLGRENRSIKDLDRLKINAEKFLFGSNENSIKRYICYSNLHITIPEALKKLNNINEI
jgi:hypothetical protein